jgi:crossover junction endodeoxyribonuclease RuvC
VRLDLGGGMELRRGVGVERSVPTRIARGQGGGGRRVLGVDPGTVVTGWGVVEDTAERMGCLASGVVRLRGERAARLAKIHRTICEVCERFRPDVVVVEKSFVGDNVQTAFRLGEARGAVMVAAVHSGLPLAEYSPAEIKLAVTGSGRASKSQMQIMVERLLGSCGAKAADEADALAAAICHLHTDRFARAASRATGGEITRVRPRRPRSARPLSIP